MTAFQYGMAVVANNKRFGVIDITGNLILPIAFHDGQICNAECVSMRSGRNGDFAFYHTRTKMWGELRFDYCADALSDGMVFVERNGKWSLYDKEENCIIKDFAEELQECSHGRFHRFWRDAESMSYLVIENNEICCMDQKGRRCLRKGRPYAKDS